MSTPLPPPHVIRRQRSGPALRKTLPPTKPIYRIPNVQPTTPPPASAPALTHTPVTPSPPIPSPVSSIATPVGASNGTRTRQLRSRRMNLARSTVDVVPSPKAGRITSNSETPDFPTVVEPMRSNQAKGNTFKEVSERKRRKVRSEGPAGFADMFPRNKRSEDIGEEIGKVEKGKSGSADVVQGLPPTKCSMEMEARFGSRVLKAIEDGRTVAALMGVKLEDNALEIMDEDEARMYQFWDGGKRRPPEEDWEALKNAGKHGAGEKLWEYRAEDLRRVYGVKSTVVDAVAAREWWMRNDGWRPLVSALGKVRSWGQVLEEEQCVKAFEHFRFHREWVKENVARYERSIGRAMWTLKNRVENLRKRRREWETAKVDDERALGGLTNLGAGLQVELDVSREETEDMCGVGTENAPEKRGTDKDRDGVADVEVDNAEKH